MDLALRDKRILVTGSSRGIGRGIADALLAEGARVVITGRDAASLDATADAFRQRYGAERVWAERADLTARDALQRTADAVQVEWGGVDAVVANIGSGSGQPGWDQGEDEWRRVFELNLWSSVRLAEVMLPALTPSGGSLLFISSIAGLESIGAPLPYSTAKAALISYTKGLAHQVGPAGVRVNCIAPGNILFPGGTWDRKLTEDRERFTRMVEQKVALQRFGTPDEIGALAAFLLSDRARFITGACFTADGGQTRAFMT